MIVLIIKALLGVFLIISFGFLLTNIILRKGGVIEKTALGYLLGVGFFTFTLFLFNLLGVAYNFTNGFGILILLNLVLLLLNIFWGDNLPRFKCQDVVKKVSSLDRLEVGLILVIGILFATSLISDLYWPVRTWDSLAVYDFRAKSFLATGFMEDALSRGYFTRYPLLTSLAHTWLYSAGWKTPMIVYNLFYMSYIVSFFFFVRKLGSRKLSLVFTAILALTSPIYKHSQIAYTNFPYLVYISLGYFFIYLWLKQKGESKYLYLAGSFVGLSLWTRFIEPFWVTSLLFVFVGSIVLKNIKHFFKYSFIVLVFYLAWVFYTQYSFNTGGWLVDKNGGLFESILLNLEIDRLVLVARYFWKNVLKSYLALYFSFFSTVLFIKKYSLAHRLYIFSVVLNILLIFVGIFVFSVEVENWSGIGNSVKRMSMFLIPLMIFGIFLFIRFTQTLFRDYK